MSYLNDPRVLFAAERTLLAWNRTAIALIGFGFLVERFGLFLHVVVQHQKQPLYRGSSFVIGIVFIALGVISLLVSAGQYVRVVKALGAKEVPRGYWKYFAVAVNFAVALVGLALLAYLALL